MTVCLCKYCSCVYISSASARIERGRIIEALRQHVAENSSDPISWSWKRGVVASSVKKVGEFHSTAAKFGVEVVEAYAGMIFTSKKNALGIVEVEQRPAFDWTDS